MDFPYFDLIKGLGEAQNAAFEYENEIEAYVYGRSDPEQVRAAWAGVNAHLVVLGGLIVKTASDYTATRVVTLGESEPDTRR